MKEQTYLIQCTSCGEENTATREETGGRMNCASCNGVLVKSGTLLKETTAANWRDEVESVEGFALVVCWSPQCGVCGQYNLSLQRVAGNLLGQARVLTLNVDDEIAIAEKLGIRGVPTVVLFKNGELVKRLPGPRGERGLREEMGLQQQGQLNL